MGTFDRDVDQLYQLPLGEFTKARDELAKRPGSDRASIKALQKPNIIAWAVNQLYWRDRGTYEALMAASKRRRSAQLAALGGQQADVPRAEAEHAAARRTAAERIRQILDDAGETASPATLQGVTTTLEALPVDEAPGRLTRALTPLGFDALAGLMKGKAPARAADVLTFKPAAARPHGPASGAKTSAAESKRADAEAHRAAETKKQEAKALAEDLRHARVAERAAVTALDRSRDQLEKARRDREQLAEQLEVVTTRVGQLTNEIRHREHDAAKATALRAGVEARAKP